MFYLVLFLILCFVLFLRLVLVLIYIRRNRITNEWYEYNNVKQLKTLIVIGSGGHTAEILRMVKHLNCNYFSPRIYIMADSDFSSESKIIETENRINFQSEYSILKIPRSRIVNQSYFTSVFTTLYSTIYCIPHVIRNSPHIILCNGPGTCVPICVISFLARLLLFYNNTIIFVESICRVKTLSLTGKILLLFADKFIVQWPELKTVYNDVTVID